MKNLSFVQAEHRELALRLIRFIIVGVFSTLLYAAMAFGIESSGTDVFVAHVIASAISLVTSYFLQKVVTFRVRGGHVRNAPRFVIATMLLVALQSLLVVGLEHLLINNQLILLASTLFYPAASFVLHNFWTFRASA